MQLLKFKLELRRLGDVKSLYSDVDLILKKNNLQGNEINAKVKIETVAHALQKMIKGNRFSILTIQKAAELCEICIDNERIKVYRLIHCLNWDEMKRDYREMIIAMILDDFRDILNYEEVKAEL